MLYVLAQILVVSTTFALAKQNVETLIHIDAKEFVEETDSGGEDSETDGFSDAALSEMLASEGLDLKVVFDDEGTVETLCARAEIGIEVSRA